LAGGVPAGGPALAGGQGMGEKREAAEGIRFQCSPRAGAARRNGSAADSGVAAVLGGAAVLWSLWEGEEIAVRLR
jgi:hypothetical protein